MIELEEQSAFGYVLDLKEQIWRQIGSDLEFDLRKYIMSQFGRSLWMCYRQRVKEELK